MGQRSSLQTRRRCQSWVESACTPPPPWHPTTATVELTQIRGKEFGRFYLAEGMYLKCVQHLVQIKLKYTKNILHLQNNTFLFKLNNSPIKSAWAYIWNLDRQENCERNYVKKPSGIFCQLIIHNTCSVINSITKLLNPKQFVELRKILEAFES